ncbi:GIY-YIG nuclease family protein [Streptomyces tanashiensis]
MNLRPPSAPPILYGAYALAGLSLIWSGYAITDLMHSGRFGLSVALAGDIGWLTVLWAEHRGVTIRVKDKVVDPAIVGWVIALGVAVLLVLHGRQENSNAQAIAGPFVVLIAKAVWSFALASLRDPAALTPEQEAEINDVIREGERRARLNGAQRDLVQQNADAVIERIRQEARITMARDHADFEITLDRLNMRAEIERNTPLAIAPMPQPSTPAALPPKPARRQPPIEPAGPTGEPVDDVQALFEGAHAPVVYFLRNGTRVKIGTSQNLRRRVTSLSLRRDDVIRVEHGDQQYERSLHRRFHDLRTGDTEWFELRDTLATYLGEPSTEPAEPSTEPEAQTPEPPQSGTALVLASSLATAPEPQAQPTNAFGFSAHLTAQSAQRAEAVEKVAELLAQDPGLTSGQVVEALSVSPATAKRYLREARAPRGGTK